MRGPLVAVALVAGVAVVVAGVSFAAIPSSDGVIYACFAQDTRVLRVLDKEAGKTCPAKRVEIHWNQEGPPGVDGADGSPGPQGQPGEDRLPGEAGALIGARLRLASAPFETGVDDSPVAVPFSPSDRTQASGTLNLLYGRVTATNDDVRCPGQVTVNVDFKIDGVAIGSTVQSNVSNPSTYRAAEWDHVEIELVAHDLLQLLDAKRS